MCMYIHIYIHIYCIHIHISYMYMKKHMLGKKRHSCGSILSPISFWILHGWPHGPALIGVMEEMLKIRRNLFHGIPFQGDLDVST